MGSLMRALVVFSFGVLLYRPCSAEVTLHWQTGFPLRAGAQVLLLWQAVPGALRYVVVRKDLDSGQERQWDAVGTQYIDGEAAGDHGYSYVLRAILPDGAAGPVSEARTLLGLHAIEPPHGLESYQEGKVVRLVWGRAEGAAFYNVYRSVAEGPASLLASVQDLKYIDAKIQPGVTYIYRVRAVGLDSRESKDSEALAMKVAAVSQPNGQEAVDRRYVEPVATIHEAPQYRLREPTDLALSGDALFVTNLGSRSVLALDLAGGFLYQFGGQPSEYPGLWGIPWGIGVSADGARIALTFLRSPNIRVFSREGKLLVDVPMGKPSQFEDRPEIPQPMDVAFDAQGHLWVTEYSYAQVVHLGPDGKELGRVGQPRMAKDPGPFRSPTFLASDPTSDSFYVVDSLRGAVFGMDRQGFAMWIWERPQAAEGPMNLPKGVCLTGDRNVMVVDGITSSLQTFSPRGTIQTVYYTKNKRYLDLMGLVSAAVDPVSGDIYALSKVDSAIYRLRVVDVAPGK